MVWLSCALVGCSRDPGPGQDRTVPPGPDLTGKRVLLLVPNGDDPRPTEAALRGYLERGGATVSYASAVASAADLADKDLALVSSYVSATGTVSLRAAAVPVVTWEHRGFDDMGMATAQGEAEGLHIAVTAVEHPLAAGLFGTVRVYSFADEVRWATPVSDATVIASTVDDGRRATIFGVRAGDRLTSGFAPARRVGLFLSDRGFDTLSQDGFSLLSAAITWALTPESNRPPQVDAGADGDGYVAVPYTLRGQVFDQNEYTVSWTGDGLTFASPTSEETTVIASEAGTYVATLTADDGEFQVADRVTLTFMPLADNEAPVVDAPRTRRGQVGAPLSLMVAASDDGVPNPLRFMWTVDGPGEATFDDPESPDPSVTFNAPGTYMVQLVVDDGATSTMVTIEVIVTVPKELILVSSQGPTPTDPTETALISLLQTRGYNVQVLSRSAAATDAAAADAVLVSAGSDLAALPLPGLDPAFKALDVPLLTWDAFSYSDLGLADGAPQESADHFATITVEGHPLAAGISGTTRLSNQQGATALGTAASEAAIRVASPADSPEVSAYFAYESGLALADGSPAPARRVALPLGVGLGQSLTADGKDLVEAALAWALSETWLARPRVLLLGDSITRGTGGHSGYRQFLAGLLDADGCIYDFVGTVQENDRALPEVLFDWDHEGHGGFTTEQLLNNLPGYLEGNVPDIALIHAGTNDILDPLMVRDMPLDEVIDEVIAGARTNLDLMITALRAENPGVVVLLAQLIGLNTEAETRDAVPLYNDMIAQAVLDNDRANSPVVLVDQYTDYDPAWNFDMVHPTPDGEAFMADRWYPALAEFISCDP